jgi:hypothetical protein
MAGILVGNHQTSYLLINKSEVAKLGSKARNFLCGKRGGERDREKEGWTDTEKVRHKEREGERADNENHGQHCVVQLVFDKHHNV